jgi:hypothetical protein
MTRLNLLCLGIVALLIACIVSTPAHSGGCYSAASYSYGYGASYYPSYSYYSAPTYSYYTPSYTPTYYTPKYEVQEVVVPKAVRAYTSPDYFASVSDYYRDKVMLDAIAGKSTDASKLAQELAEIKQQLKGQSQAPQVQSPPPQTQYQQPVYQPQVQVPMVPQSTYAPPQQQGYAPSGGTPCDWRAQQAYQQGLQAAQQQYAAQQPQQPPPQYQGQYAPQYGQQGQQQQQPYSQQYGPSNQQPQGQGVNPYSQQGRPPVQQPQQPQQAPQSPLPQTRQDTTPPQELPSSFSQESNRGGGSSGNRPRSQPVPSQPPEGESRAPADNGSVPDGLAAVVGENCLRCHGANNAEQGGSFDLRDLKAIPLEDRAESYTQVVSGEMPRKSNTLSKEHQLLFKDWYRAAVKARRTRAAEATASNGRVASSN